MQKKELQKEPSRLLKSPCTICEEEGNIILKMEMPGVAKELLDVHVDGNQLLISGRREDPAIKGEYLIRERKQGDFQQVYTIDETVDKEKIDALLDAGVLTLTLHLKEAEKPRRIEVKVG